MKPGSEKCAARCSTGSRVRLVIRVQAPTPHLWCGVTVAAWATGGTGGPTQSYGWHWGPHSELLAYDSGVGSQTAQCEVKCGDLRRCSLMSRVRRRVLRCRARGERRSEAPCRAG
jgi:hypothetical protein